MDPIIRTRHSIQAGCLAWALMLVPAGAAASRAQIFFSDLESGPNSGGQNNAGAFVTVYGTGFGATRETSFVTAGTGKVAGYPIWTDTRITIQLGAAAQTGEIVVTTQRGASNGVPFKVRPGGIYFVATNGNDGSSGSYASPWRTLPKARDAIKPGDIIYAMNGVSQTTDDSWNAALLLRTGRTAGAPKALVAYPGAVVTVGSVSGPLLGIRSTDFSAGGGACPGYWVFAGLVVRGSGGAIAVSGPSANWRIVGNDMSCPNGDGAGACFDTSQAQNVSLLGNTIHHAGKAEASALYHGVYFSTDSNHIDAGWNTIEYVRGCRGLQVHSSPLIANTGYNQYDISIHDNLIHDTQCDGIVLATVDPSKGKVEVYNNVIYNAGQGPDNPEHTGHWSCILVSGYTNAGSAGGGTVEVYNNTLSNCGTFLKPPYADAKTAISNGGHNQNLRIRIRNNIVSQPAGIPYITIWTTSGVCRDSSNCPGIFGFNNLFYGNGAVPANSNITNSINRDPLFVDAARNDFHLRGASPARGAGVDTGAASDKDGLQRGGAFGYDLGAFQVARPDLSAIRCGSPYLRTPGATSCRVNLDGCAPDDLDLTIRTNSASLVLPSSVVLPAGGFDLTFRVEATLVGSRMPVTVSAVLGDSSRSVQLWLLPLNDYAPGILSVANSASLLAGPVAPGELVTVFGFNLGQAANCCGSAQAVPSALFDDLAAPVLWSGADQLNSIVPFEIGNGTDVHLDIVVCGLRSGPVPLVQAPVSPGVFTMDSSGVGQAVAANEDGLFNSPARPAAKTSVITFYATGLGRLESSLGHSAAPVSVSVGGVDAEVITLGAADPAVRISIRVPGNIDSGDVLPLIVRTGSTESQPGVTLAIQ